MLQIAVPGDADAVRRAICDLGASPLFSNLSEDLRQNAEIVLAEVMNNIVEHAYAGHAGTITLAFRPQNMGLACQITDTGAAMPRLSLPEGKVQVLDRIEDLPEGGFGWHLIRSLTKDLTYRREDGVNYLTFCLCCEQSDT